MDRLSKKVQFPHRFNRGRSSFAYPIGTVGAFHPCSAPTCATLSSVIALSDEAEGYGAEVIRHLYGGRSKNLRSHSQFLGGGHPDVAHVGAFRPLGACPIPPLGLPDCAPFSWLRRLVPRSPSASRRRPGPGGRYFLGHDQASQAGDRQAPGRSLRPQFWASRPIARPDGVAARETQSRCHRRRRPRRSPGSARPPERVVIKAPIAGSCCGSDRIVKTGRTSLRCSGLSLDSGS